MDVLLDRMVDHAASVTVDSSTPLNQELFSELSRESVIESLSQSAKLRLINSLAPLIPTLQQDPTPAATLLSALLRSDGLPPFSQILSMEPESDVLAGLQTPLEPLNLLTISLLSCVETPADVWLVAGKREIVHGLIGLWLNTRHTAVAEQSAIVLQDMLRLDGPFEDDGSMSSREEYLNPNTRSKPSTGLIWKRIFKDRDIYSLIYRSCCLESIDSGSKPDKAKVTIAQGRLLDLLAKIFYAPQIWESQLPEVERAFGISPGGGILEFAMLKMIDYEDDLLMHMHLIEFFGELLKSKAGIRFAVPMRLHQEVSTDSSVALDLLISSGLHERTAAYYTNPNSDDIFADYLYGPAGKYIETYAQSHTIHFQKHMAEKVIVKTGDKLSSITRSAWAHQRAPVHELRMIASIPRQTVLAVDYGAVVLSLPITPSNEAALSALAHIFQGPDKQESERYAIDSEFLKLERASARALFFLYTTRHPDFWFNLVHAASVTASLEAAVAAVRLMKAIIDSSWVKLPQSRTGGVISEDDLKAKCASYPHLPQKGALIVMMEPALGRVLPFLLKGAENNSANAYTIAREKHEILPVLRKRLEEATAEVDDDERPEAWSEMLELLRHRQSLGPTGGNGQSIRVPNPEVGTMEL